MVLTGAEVSSPPQLARKKMANPKITCFLIAFFMPFPLWLVLVAYGWVLILKVPSDLIAVLLISNSSKFD